MIRWPADCFFADLMIIGHTSVNRSATDLVAKYHQQVINALDKTLIPGATNDELKARLIKVDDWLVAENDCEMRRRPPQHDSVGRSS